ncbi:hypothetical protein ACFLWG_04250 [Chloroflexota bacterium]
MKKVSDCPRCGIGLLYREANDIVCICCGYRISFKDQNDFIELWYQEQAKTIVISRLMWNKDYTLINELRQEHLIAAGLLSV